MDDNELVYVCDECDKTYKKIGDYLRHMLLHDDTDLSVIQEARRCKICGYLAPSFSRLTTHLKTHSGVKPFKCNNCGYSFISQGALVAHKRIHEHRGVIQCNKCTCSFDSKTSLALHSRVHREPKK